MMARSLPDRRSRSMMNFLQRSAWPKPLVLVLGQRVAPLFCISAMLAASMWATTPDILGIFDSETVLWLGTVLVLIGALYLPWRFLTFVGVSIVELGLAMTLLFQGSFYNLEGDVEKFGSALHGVIWALYTIVLIVTEHLRAVTDEVRRA